MSGPDNITAAFSPSSSLLFQYASCNFAAKYFFLEIHSHIEGNSISFRSFRTGPGVMPAPFFKTAEAELELSSLRSSRLKQENDGKLETWNDGFKGMLSLL